MKNQKPEPRFFVWKFPKERDWTIGDRVGLRDDILGIPIGTKRLADKLCKMLNEVWEKG